MNERIYITHKKPTRTPKLAKTERQRIFVYNLRWAIERLGLTLGSLAVASGVQETWLRRAATQGVYWTRKSSKDPVGKLEEFLGCQTGTLWDKDGERFRIGVSVKHLRTRAPVTDLGKVIQHFEGRPPPLLTRVIEIIEYLRGSIDDPSLEPPVEITKQEGNQQLPEQSSEGMATWNPSSGWRFSEAGIQYFIGTLEPEIKQMTQIGIPCVEDTHIDRNDI